MKNAPLTLSAIALMMTSALAYPALAQTNTDAKPPSTSGANSSSGGKIKDMRQFSQAGHSAMTSIGDARLAIFDGDPKVAMKFMESAKAFLAQADKEAASTGGGAMGGEKTKEGTTEPRMRSVPVDGQLALADDFVMTPAKKMHIDKANESFKKGDHTNGLEELRLGQSM